MNPLASDALSLNPPSTLPESDAALLLFRFGSALWALPALAVREIHALPGLSPLPETAPWVAGMFVLRGEIVPVVDLGARFGEVSPRPALEDAVIVLDFAGAPLAILAQQVCAVGRFAASQIGAPPAHGRQMGLEAPFVAGVTRWEDEIVLVLDLSHLLDFSLGAASRAAPRFDSHPWTPGEREVLQHRAASLQGTASAENGDDSNFDGSDLDGFDSEGSHPDGFDFDGFDFDGFDLAASGGEKRAPVAIFSLGGEEFAAPLESVREFASVTGVSSVPCCPPHILGQINLRGEVVTLLDVRAILRTPRLEPPFFAASPPRVGEAKSVSVVVVEHQGAGVGLAVDAVRDVLYLRSDQWSALGQSGGETRAGDANRSFFARGAIVEGRLLPLLDIARLIGQGGLEVDETA